MDYDLKMFESGPAEEGKVLINLKSGSLHMQIQENVSLKPFNTFGIGAVARHFAVFRDMDELAALLQSGSALPGAPLILGGGSNILFLRDFDGLLLKNEIMGMRELHEDKEFVYVKAGAGENWHGFVKHCIGRNWAGVENLSLIPGSVGAAPIQNIGAYGVELAELFWSLDAYHLAERKRVTFTGSDCAFGYRDSIFKGKYRNQFAILNVTLQLRKHPIFRTSYGSIREELEKMAVKGLTIQAVSDAVIRIRTGKLPDPAIIGNAGSFFKNPEISAEQFSDIHSRFPGIVYFPLANGRVKLAAAWMIEQCGWKGYRKGDAGVHEKQALVLVNYGNAGGREIYDLSEEILLSVKEKFGISLEREVNIAGL